MPKRIKRQESDTLPPAITLDGVLYKPIELIYRSNPYEVLDYGKASYAEFFVGAVTGMIDENGRLRIASKNEQETISDSDVLDFIAYNTSGASVIRQVGIYEGVQEPSYRITIYNVGEPEKMFMDRMYRFGHDIAKYLLQKEVIIHFVSEGSDSGTASIAWKD